MESITAKVRTGAFWVASSRGIVNGLSFISTLVLARLLVPADFGIVAIGTTFLTLVNTFTDLSLTQAIVHHAAPEKRHLDTVWTLNFLRGLILAAIILGASPLMAAFYHDQRLILVMAAVATSAFCTGLVNPSLAILKRDLQFWQDFVQQTSKQLSMVVISVILGLIFKNYLALIGAIVGSQLVFVATSYVISPFIPAFRLKEYKEFFSFSGWLTLSQLMSTLNFRMDPLIVGRFVGAHSLGLFTVSLNLANLPTRETTLPLTSALFPAFRKLRDNPERLRKAYLRAATLLFAIALPCGTMLAVVATPLIPLVMSKKWLEAIPLVQVLAITAALTTLATNGTSVAMATGDTARIFRRQTQVFLYRLPINVVALWLGGLPGLMIARWIVCALSILMDLLLVRDVLGLTFKQQILPNWRTLVACAAMWGIGRAANHALYFGPHPQELFASVVALTTLAGLTYLGLTVSLWLMSGKPQGPESEMLGMAYRSLTRVRQLMGSRRQQRSA